MIQVVKKRDSNNSDRIFIKTDSGDFAFIFGGTMDLYFCYLGKHFKRIHRHSFILDKSNYFLYKCFDDLYEIIKSERPFKEFDPDSHLVYEHEKFPYPLLKNGVIEWHSDDGYYANSAVLYIEKLGEKYKITLKEGYLSDISFPTSTVRFRNSGSFYEPYNASFMSLYKKLCDHNFENEQITMDEYIDRIKVRKR